MGGVDGELQGADGGLDELLGGLARDGEVATNFGEGKGFGLIGVKAKMQEAGLRLMRGHGLGDEFNQGGAIIFGEIGFGLWRGDEVLGGDVGVG